MNARPPIDDAARRRAVIETERNIVVSAGAGTGKTSLIVERLLVRLGAGGTTLGRIAAITFTEKAAGELRLRLANELGGLSDQAASDRAADLDAPAGRALAHLEGLGHARADIAERARRAVADLDRALVTTIHGFCVEILREHPIEAQLPPGFQVDRGPSSARIAKKEWETFLEEELGASATREDVWRSALAAVGPSQLEKLARGLARGAVPTGVLARPYRAVEFASTLGTIGKQLADRLREAREATPGLTNVPRAWIDEAIADLERGACDEVPTLPNFRTKKVGDGEASLLEFLAREANAWRRATIDCDERAVAAVLEAVLPYSRRLRERLYRAGLVDFDTLLVATRDLLRDRPDVRAKVKERFTSILVDEFQDTDPLQYEIVFYLAERAGHAAESAWSARLAPGRLFIVGDAKQSIYRFRGADYAAYRRAVERVREEGGIEIALTANFRSRPGVLAPINAIGATWTPSAYLPDYEAIEAHRPATDLPAVEVWSTPSGVDRARHRRRAEGRTIAAEIRTLAAAGTKYGEILILLRSVSSVSLYLRELREADIPFVASGGRTFYERTEIVQALGVLRAVADPSDPIARLAFLRSPAGGAPDTELLRAAEAGVHPATTPNVDAADRRLLALRAEVETLPVDVSVRHVLERTGLFALNAIGFEGAQRVANLEKLASDASEFARDGRMSLLELVQALEDRPRGEDEGDSPLADEGGDAVRVMTIHRAKGLEAPVVILADAAASRGNHPERDFTIGVVREGADERIAVSGPGLCNVAFAARRLENRLHEEAEDHRLLYVALTRAQERLIVLAAPNVRRAPWMDALARWGYDAAAPPPSDVELLGGAVRFRLIDPAVPAELTISGAPAGAPEAVERYARAVLASKKGRGTFLAPSAEAIPPVSSGGADSELARAVGIAVHEQLARSGVPPRSEEVAAQSRAILDGFAASPLASRHAAVDVVGREVPILLHREDGSLWRGSIDLLYRDPDGTLVVADYKTDAQLEGATERHAGQLRAYSEAIRRAVPGRVRAELWMLRHGEILAVDGT